MKLNWFVEKIGFRKLMVLANSYLTLTTLILFFYSEIYFTIFLLATTSIALAFIEPIREIYFFKNVNFIEEEKTYPIFYTSFSIGNIIGKILISTILLFFSYNYAYLIISLVMGSTVCLVYNMKDYYK